MGLLTLVGCSSDAELVIERIAYQDGSPVKDSVVVVVDGLPTTCAPLAPCHIPVEPPEDGPRTLELDAKLAGVTFDGPFETTISGGGAHRIEVLRFFRDHMVFVQADVWPGSPTGDIAGLEVWTDGILRGRTDDYGQLYWSYDIDSEVFAGDEVIIEVRDAERSGDPIATERVAIEEGRFEYDVFVVLGDEQEGTPPGQAPERRERPSEELATLTLTSDPPGVQISLRQQGTNRSYPPTPTPIRRRLPQGRYAYTVESTPAGYKAVSSSGTIDLSGDRSTFTIDLEESGERTLTIESVPPAPITVTGRETGTTYTLESGEPTSVTPDVYEWRIDDPPPGFVAQTGRELIDVTRSAQRVRVALEQADVASSFSAGVTAREEGRYRDAVRHFQAIPPPTSEAQDPMTYMQAQQYVGSIFLRDLRQPADAVEAFRNVLRIREEYVTRLDLALALYEGGSYDEALESAEQVRLYLPQIPGRERQQFANNVSWLRAMCAVGKFESASDERRKDMLREEAIRALVQFIRDAGNSADFADRVRDAQETLQRLTGESN